MKDALGTARARIPSGTSVSECEECGRNQHTHSCSHLLVPRIF
jgi:hypothetical protein